jgi:hypothetical protein
MSNEKLLMYGAAAYIAYTVIKKRGLSVSGGVAVGGNQLPVPTTKAQENALNAQTAINLAAGLKGLFTSGNTTDSQPTVTDTSQSGTSDLYSTDASTASDFWAVNPPAGYN